MYIRCRQVVALLPKADGNVFGSVLGKVVDQIAKCFLSVVLSPFEMSPTTVVSPSNLAMRFLLWFELQSWVQRRYRRGLSTNPCGQPMHRVQMEERCGSCIVVACSRRKLSFSHCTNAQSYLLYVHAIIE